MRLVSRSLSESEIRQVAEHAFGRVFRSSDPFDEPFTPMIPRRAILYPVAYELNDEESQALFKAGRAVGDTSLFVSVTERPSERAQDRPYHWEIPLDDVNAYRSLNQYVFVLQNAIYSKRGQWGVLFSHEQHALIGGSREFLDVFFAHISVSPDLQVKEFLSTWWDYHDRLGSDVDWLPRLLEHVYGQAKAHRLLKKAGLL